MVNAAILFIQDLFTHQELITRTDATLLALNALFLGAGVFANLGFEEIGLDLYVVALLALISAYLLWRRGRQPMFINYTIAYWLGLVGSVIAQALR
jgi:ABC-type Co2+ transport system permease subunit